MALQPSSRQLRVRGITPEERAQRLQAFQRLVDMLRPFVAPVARQKAVTDLRATSAQTLLGGLEGLPLILRWLAKIRLRLALLTGRFQKDLETNYVDHAVMELATTWAHVCVMAAAENESGSRTMQAGTLDQHMLPPRIDPTDEFEVSFDDCFAGCAIDASDARAILAKIRAKLPEGQVFPDEMAQLLAAHRITIVP